MLLESFITLTDILSSQDTKRNAVESVGIRKLL